MNHELIRSLHNDGALVSPVSLSVSCATLVHCLRRCLHRLLVVVILSCLSFSSLTLFAAIDDAPEFDTAAQEAQYYNLIKEIRCPTCQNNNVAESNAPLARQLRQQIAQQVQQGKDSDAIRSYLIARYGDFISYRPPFNPRTWLLWLLPIGLMVIALFIWLLIRGRQRQIASLTPEQQAELHALLLQSQQSQQNSEQQSL